MSAYTFGSGYLGDVLINTSASVEVLVEGSPPGGFPTSTDRVLDRITEEAEVYVADGEQSRYRYFHAKYAVIDDTAVVTSENWDSDNFSPDANGSRGWSIVVESDGLADYLAEVFREDTDWRTVSSWENASVKSHSQNQSDTGVRTDFSPLRAGGATVEVFLAPDDTVEPVVSLIESADEEVLVQQAYVRG